MFRERLQLIQISAIRLLARLRRPLSLHRESLPGNGKDDTTFKANKMWSCLRALSRKKAPRVSSPYDHSREFDALWRFYSLLTLAWRIGNLFQASPRRRATCVRSDFHEHASTIRVSRYLIQLDSLYDTLFEQLHRKATSWWTSACNTTRHEKAQPKWIYAELVSLNLACLWYKRSIPNSLREDLSGTTAKNPGCVDIGTTSVRKSPWRIFILQNSGTDFLWQICQRHGRPLLKKHVVIMLT